MIVLKFTEEQFRSGDSLRYVLTYQRKDLDISSLNLGLYLGMHWDISQQSARNFIVDYERDNRRFVKNIVNCIQEPAAYIGLDKFRRRLSDQIAAIDINKDKLEETEELFKKIHPGFKLLESNVLPYHKFMKEMKQKLEKNPLFNSEDEFPSQLVNYVMNTGILGIINNYHPPIKQ